MEENSSGPDLVRRALCTAKTRSEREAAQQAAIQAAHEIGVLLHQHCHERGEQIDFDPIVVARERVIRELHAATRNTGLTPVSFQFLSPVQHRAYEEELQMARELSAEVVRQTLRPPAAGQ